MTPSSNTPCGRASLERVEFRTQDEDADADVSQDAAQLVASAQAWFQINGAYLPCMHQCDCLPEHVRLPPRAGASGLRKLLVRPCEGSGFF